MIERFVSEAGVDAALVLPVLQMHAAEAAWVQYLGINELGPTRGRSAISRRSASATRRSCWPPSPSAATTPVCAPKPGWSARVAAPPGRALLRGRRADARLPHDPGPRRPAHDERPAVQGRGAGPLEERLHGADQDPRARQRHERLPDQPQPHAVSEGAWAESVPNLDIETNDVKCSHASTVGPIDEDQRFYLESRGVAPRGRRAAGRARLLRRGARAAARRRPRRRPAPAGGRQARPRTATTGDAAVELRKTVVCARRPRPARRGGS